MRYPMSEILPTVFECLTASELKQRLKLPLIAAPMFKVSSPELVTAVCRAGAIGAFHSINARTPALFDAWMARLGEALSEALPDGSRPPPPAVHLLPHPHQPRFPPDLAPVRK